MKDMAYYSTIPMAYPNRDDFKKVFVYSKGKTIVNGAKRSECTDAEMSDYRAKGYTVETDFDKDAYYAETRKYGAINSALEAEFKADLLAEYGVTGHPKADKCFSLAWDHGHSSGYGEVKNYFDDYVELILP